MRRFAIVCALAVSLMGMSVHAQQKGSLGPAGAQIPVFEQSISIEDDVTGSFLVFDPNTGNYKFYRCNDGFSMSGTGLVSFNGCAVSFEDKQPDRRVLASINMCVQEASAAVESFAPRIGPPDITPMKEYLRDLDMRDNTLSCLPKK